MQAAQERSEYEVKENFFCYQESYKLKSHSEYARQTKQKY